jgi:Arc/MetJ-type ribon-helix-helix transcriptional regulator
MAIHLKPEHERIILEEIEAGHFRNADEVLDRALAALRAQKPDARYAVQDRVLRAQAAAAKIRELRKGLSLGGLNIKDLIEEGRL